MIQYTRRRTSIPAKYPNHIREYRLRAGITQAKLGETIGKRRPLVSSWERGQSLPTLPNAFLLARALGTLSEALYSALYSPKRSEGRPPGGKS
ncbi:MAG: helix-turn-helix domain-containing protein [Candidatus Eisenbacteria bacterium]|nr:helix-turn-helix domain-containing protein [Candidatus Eisenbacteria bacterium]MBU1947875.1 helix-turn-helix domain-containing protein [Candidatus Eisenbacteria bacterium]